MILLNQLRPLTCTLVFVIFAANMYASDSPLKFESIKVLDVSDQDGQSFVTAQISPSNDYPFTVHFSIGPILKPHFEIEATLAPSQSEINLNTQTALSFHLAATYEVYWDDILIGTNGKLSLDGEELETGRSYRTFALPSSIDTSIYHTLRIRGFHTHESSTRHQSFLSLRTLEETIAMGRSDGMTYMLFLGFALFGIYLLAYFALNRSQTHYLFLGASCMLFGLYAVNKLFYFQLNVSYPNLDWIGSIGSTINMLLSVTAPVSVFLILGLRRKWFYAFVALPFLVSNYFDNIKIVPSAFYLCLGISLVGILLRRRQSLQCAVVSSILVCIYEVPYLANNQAIGFGALMLYFLVSVIILLSNENRQRGQAQLRNTRLQLELLKSKIQPHFVLNSLTSAIEWIETNPKEGTKLIQELANEFELISGISDKDTIPLATEIELCRSYLAIMEFRKKAEYELVLKNVRLDESLPPSIIRNLLENAITHNAYDEGDIRFDLEQIESPKERTFRFSAPLADSNSSDETQPNPDGTGIRYIKARLAECYQSWSFDHGRNGDVWVTEISIRS